MTTGSTATTRASMVGQVGAGVVGGLVGGVAFGFMMLAEDMLPMVAMLVESESVGVGWVVHLAISIFAGAVFGVIGAMLTSSLQASVGKLVPASLGLGLVYGVIWWVLGALLIMPARLGMTDMIFAWTDTARSSLIGHLVFGALLGVVYGLLAPRLGRRS